MAEGCAQSVRTEQEFCPYAGTALSVHGWKEAMDENPESAIYLLRHALGVNADDQERHAIPVDIECARTMPLNHKCHGLRAFNDPSVPGFTNELPGDEVRRAPLCESDLAERALEKDRILLRRWCKALTP